MKVLVLGSQGMAGHMITKYLNSRGYDVTTAARSGDSLKIVVEDPSSIDAVVLGQKYDYVINCIGVLVQASTNDPARAILVNSWFPHYLEKILKDTETKLVHISTDCVFNGVVGNYVETDLPTETNFYGRSKALGEVNNNKDITLRVSIIGPEIKNDGTGLLKWALTNTESTIPGWENAWWNGVTTLQLAKNIEKYMLDPKITGIYHAVPKNHTINKYELLTLINKVYSLGKEVIRTKGPKGINKILIDTRQEFDFGIPDYTTMLEELRDFMLH